MAAVAERPQPYLGFGPGAGHVADVDGGACGGFQRISPVRAVRRPLGTATSDLAPPQTVNICRFFEKQPRTSLPKFLEVRGSWAAVPAGMR